MSGSLWKGFVVPVSLIAAWEIAGRAGFISMETMSQPSEILAAWLGAFRDGTLMLATGQTLEATFFGFLVASILGVVAGALIGTSRTATLMLAPSLEVLRPVPPVALIPLALLLLGFGVSMELAVVAFACVWPILIATAAAIRNTEPALHEVARILELSTFSYFTKIVLPAALARIGVGMRIALGVALVVAVTVEIVVNPRGLGYRMIIAQQSLHPDLMYALLFWVGCIGWLLNYGLVQLDRRVLAQYAGGASR